ncbi:hypothetical protein BOO69_09625 [Sulfitobacter alexandrii]|uniref:Uncharacterized protein n=1 Tax=Sulfitobacter alexandrii TaxID=1917485 RepID=A0A1J0WH34_9RHOB|nr:DUF6527 family protein [Sulfitobacter alexandrii]APE43644.1 hypothetical protein BOO69_09625 [Sulfitobacter alexandrii]
MVRAIQFIDLTDMRRMRIAGSFHLRAREQAGLFEMHYLCPCGCGHEGRLLIGNGHKPGGKRASWKWNGSKTEPTLLPSVHHQGHWHGWLTDGYWETV